MEEKVRAIIQVAASLFARKGIRAVTMTELAQECGISKKTLYFYFRDKDHLLLTVILINYRFIRTQTIQLNEEQKSLKNSELNRFFKLVKMQSKIFTPIFFADLIKYNYRISQLVDWYFKRFIDIQICKEDGRSWYEWQLRQIFRDLTIAEEERQELLDQINNNYYRLLYPALIQNV